MIVYIYTVYIYMNHQFKHTFNSLYIILYFKNMLFIKFTYNTEKKFCFDEFSFAIISLLAERLHQQSCSLPNLW